MASVSSALQRIKQDLRPFLPERVILSACRQADHHWRQRMLGPVQTIHLFILQVLNFNTAMTGLRHLSKAATKAPAYCKARMRLQLKSKTAEGVLKELAVYALVYNLVHLLMLRAAQRQQVQPDRISFIDTVRWLIRAEPGEPLPDLGINPYRPGRHEPRVVKDREDTYAKMTRPRAVLRKELLAK